MPRIVEGSIVTLKNENIEFICGKEYQPQSDGENEIGTDRAGLP